MTNRCSSSTLAALAAALTIFAVSCSKPQQDDQSGSGVAVVTLGKVGLQDVNITVTAPATVFPRQQASVASRVTAPIRTLHVRKGDSVDAGEVLAVLDNRDTQAQLEDARAQLADAEANLQKTVSGTVPGDIERARGQVDVAEAALSQAQKNYERRSQLFKEGVIPNRDLLQAQTDLAQAKATADVAKRALDLLKNQSSERDIRSAQARADSAKARLALANTQLQFTEIRAPFNGTITEQSMYPGDMANPGAAIFQVMDLSVLTARAQVPESSATGVRRGQPCSFTPADNPSAQVTGAVTVINRAVDPQRRTIEVWCEIQNRSRTLAGNLFGQVSVVTSQLKNSAVVPVSAVQFDEGTRDGAVLVVDANMVAHSRSVRTAEASGAIVPVLDGLRPGETIVVQGGYGLPDKTKVQVARQESANKTPTDDGQR